MPATHQTLSSVAVRLSGTAARTRETAEETPVALVYDASTHAILMATPTDLADFGIGFSLTEGIVSGRDGIADMEIVERADRIEIRIWLSRSASSAHRTRRRAMIGPTGCGLCGVESLEAAIPKLERVASGFVWTSVEIAAAVAALEDHQPLGRATRAVHAAGLWCDGAMLAVREDVGRHNALDKLAGATIDQRPRSGAIVALTSRVSVEMVQKAARMGVGCIAAVSAPTALAVRTAEAAGVALAAVVRDDGFEIFANSNRILIEAPLAALG